MKDVHRSSFIVRRSFTSHEPRAASREPRPAGRAGQTILELALGIMATLILFVGMVNIWAWFNETMVRRYESYQGSRLTAGQPESAGTPNPYKVPALDVLEGVGP